MTLHKDIAGADLHEPKGIATAASNSAYISNGSGSGSWIVQTTPVTAFTLNTTVFTSSGTWTKPAGLILARIYCVGAGGNASNPSTGSTGSTGGSSLFGLVCSASGGTGGSSAAGGSGGIGSGGDLNLSGASGQYSSLISSGCNITGGMGAGWFGAYGQGSAVTNIGTIGTGSGGGGGMSVKNVAAGSLSSTVAVTVSGGLVVVEEFITA